MQTYIVWSQKFGKMVNIIQMWGLKVNKDMDE